MSDDTVVLAHVSDLHCGGTTALCPGSIALDDGGEYHASKAQRWLWQCWYDYWDLVSAARRKYRAKLYVVLNGDLVEGDHHKTTQILSGNPNAQAAVVNQALAVPLGLEPDHIWIVRGTEAHVGQSASAEERIADGLRRDKRPVVGDADTGTASHWHPLIQVHNTLIDVAHHGRTGMREHTRAGAASLHAHDIFLSYAKRGERPPHLALRAHFHRFNDSYDAAPTRVATSGAWQLGTAHVHKIAADSLADVGGHIVTVRPDGYRLRKVQFHAKGPTIWRAAA